MTLPTLEPIVQKSSDDCGIAALAMALARPYREVSEAALRLFTRPHRTGLSMPDLVQIGQEFNAEFETCDPTEWADVEIGIAMLQKKVGQKTQRHIVTLFQGVLFNPADGLAWNYGAYLATKRYKPFDLMERVA